MTRTLFQRQMTLDTLTTMGKKMESFSFQNIQTLEVALPVVSTTSAIFFAAIYGEWIALLFAKFGQSLSNRKAFADNFWLLAVTTIIVIMVVKFSLALSLGLVGALSIVRFRAAIKEPEELIYLFLVISIGIACGAGQLKAAGLVLLISSVIFYARDIWIRKKINSTIKDYSTGAILSVSGLLEDRVKVTDFLDEALGRKNYKLVSVNMTNNTFESVYSLNAEIDDDLRAEILDWASRQTTKQFSVRYGSQALIAT